MALPTTCDCNGRDLGVVSIKRSSEGLLGVAMSDLLCWV